MAQSTITIDIDEALDREFERIASEAGHTKPEIVREALAEWLEDQEDGREALRILMRNVPWSSSADVRKRLGRER
jgi:predicted transcriptional regulator